MKADIESLTKDELPDAPEPDDAPKSDEAPKADAAGGDDPPKSQVSA